MFNSIQSCTQQSTEWQAHLSTLNFTRSTLPSLDWATHSRLKEKLGTPVKLCDQMFGSRSRDIAKASPTCTPALFLSCVEICGLSSQVSNTFGTDIFKIYNALNGSRIPFNSFSLPRPELALCRASVSRKTAHKNEETASDNFTNDCANFIIFGEQQLSEFIDVKTKISFRRPAIVYLRETKVPLSGSLRF